MGVLRNWFGPSKDEVWGQLARELRADFVDGGFWRGSKVQASVKEWSVTLDTYTVSTGKSHITYTRMRAPYVNKDGFRFRIFRKGFFSELGKLFGMQDVEVGHPWFDEEFIIQGNHVDKLRLLFADPSIRQLIEAQPAIRLEVKDDEGWFGAHFPRGRGRAAFPGSRHHQGHRAAEIAVRVVRKNARPPVRDRLGIWE